MWWVGGWEGAAHESFVIACGDTLRNKTVPAWGRKRNITVPCHAQCLVVGEHVDLNTNPCVGTEGLRILSSVALHSVRQ